MNRLHLAVCRLTIAALLLLLFGGCSGCQRQATPVSQAKFGMGGRLVYIVDTHSDSRVTQGGNQQRLIMEQQTEYSLEGRQDWLELQLRQVRVNMLLGNQAVVSMLLSPEQVTGSGGGKPLHEAVEASREELVAMVKSLLEEPFGRMQFGPNGDVLQSERLAPVEAETLVSTGALDLASLLLAPDQLNQRIWTRKCRYPLEAGVAATGPVTFEISQSDWNKRDENWFLPVNVTGTLSADGVHEVTIVASVAKARSGQLKKARVKYSNSSYKIRGQLLYSRQTGQFHSGKLQVSAQHTGGEGKDAIQLTGTQTVTLKSVRPDQPLPLPRDDQLLATASLAATPSNEARSLLRGAQKGGNGWRIDLEWEPKGESVFTLNDPKRSRLFVADGAGQITRWDLDSWSIDRQLSLGAPCQGMCWTPLGLAVLCRTNLLLLIDPETLKVKTCHSCLPADSIGGSRALPWVALGSQSTDGVRIIDLQSGKRIYNLTTNNLGRLEPAQSGEVRRARPSDLHRGGFTPDGRQLVLLGKGFHRMRLADKSLFYEEDSTEVNSDGRTLLFADDNLHIAVRSEKGHGPVPGRSLIPQGPGTYVYALDRMLTRTAQLIPKQRPVRINATSAVALAESGLVTRVPFERGRVEALITNGLGPRIGEALRLVEVGENYVLFGREGACLMTNERSPPKLLSRPFPFRLTPAKFSVSRLDVSADPSSELTQFPSLQLPGRMRKVRSINAYEIAWSRGGDAFFILLEDGSVVRGEMATRRLTHRVVRKDEKPSRVQCGRDNLIVSESNKSWIFDPSTLECRGRLDLITRSEHLACPNGDGSLSTLTHERCFLWLDLNTETYRRIFAHDIAGLTETQQKVLDESLGGDRRKRIWPLLMSQDGRFVLVGLGREMLVLQSGPQWQLKHAWHLDEGLGQPQIGGPDLLVLSPLKRGSDLKPTVVDWRKPEPELFAVAPGFSPPQLFYAPSRQRGWVIQGKQLQVIDAGGKQQEMMDIYRGRVSNSVAAIFVHPQQQDCLAYFATERTLCWFK